jgi:hypothetical protein
VRIVVNASGAASLLRNWEPGAVALNREGGYTVALIPNGLFQSCEAIDAFIGRRLPGTTALNPIKSYVSCSGQDVIERIVNSRSLQVHISSSLHAWH